MKGIPLQNPMQSPVHTTAHSPTRGCAGSCCLYVKNLSVTIGSSSILQDVNLHLHCGEMAALIGPNGAGKSTLIRAILGQQAYDGIISFSPAGGRRIRPRIGYVPQSPSFDPSDPISVLDLFACCTSRRPAFLPPSQGQRRQFLHCLAHVHAESLLDKRIGTLSGGEIQRVLLALALEPMPNILILDEPLSGVDVEGMERVMEMLDEIRKQFDLSILMITHDFSMLERYIDQVILLQGTVLKTGSPKSVLQSREFQEAFHMKGGAGL